MRRFLLPFLTSMWLSIPIPMAAGDQKLSGALKRLAAMGVTKTVFIGVFKGPVEFSAGGDAKKLTDELQREGHGNLQYIIGGSRRSMGFGVSPGHLWRDRAILRQAAERANIYVRLCRISADLP